MLWPRLPPPPYACGARHAKRATNTAALMAALREVNVAIDRASRLRCGYHRAACVAAARAAVKANNAGALVAALHHGGKAPA